MSDYKPSSIVAKLAEKMRAVPIAESIKLDGTVVIIFEDGRKIIFDRDDITRTLTEPALPTSAAREAETRLEDEDARHVRPRTRKVKGES